MLVGGVLFGLGGGVCFTLVRKRSEGPLRDGPLGSGD